MMEKRKILIVNTLDGGQYSAELESLLQEKEAEFKIINSDAMNISHCVGCNHC